jgi:hypothetical protein
LYISHDLDENDLEIINQGIIQIIKLENFQEYLDENYSTEESKREVIELDISKQNLGGDLNLKGFVNLKDLNCDDNKLTSLKIVGSPKLEILSCANNELANLNVSTCSNLKTLWCYGNLLTELDLSQNKKLEQLIINDNCFPDKDLAFLSYLVNLYRLEIGNIMHWENLKLDAYNRFTGSLEPLKNLTQLVVLEIDNTDLDSGLEYLPFSLKLFSCLAGKREDAKVKTLELELKKYGEAGENEELIHLLQEWRKDKSCSHNFWCERKGKRVRRRTPNGTRRSRKSSGKSPRMARKATSRNNWAERLWNRRTKSPIREITTEEPSSSLT